MRSSYIGEQVFVLLDPLQNNNQDYAVAWVASVWSMSHPWDGLIVQKVNLRVLGDDAAILWLTNVSLCEERPRTEDLYRICPEVPGGYRAVAFRKHVDL